VEKRQVVDGGIPADATNHQPFTTNNQLVQILLK
jgi:hypothetical protein